MPILLGLLLFNLFAIFQGGDNLNFEFQIFTSEVCIFDNRIMTRQRFEWWTGEFKDRTKPLCRVTSAQVKV